MRQAGKRKYYLWLIIVNIAFTNNVQVPVHTLRFETSFHFKAITLYRNVIAGYRYCCFL